MSNPLQPTLANTLLPMSPRCGPEQWLFPSPAAKDGRTVNLDKPFRRCVLAAGLDVKQVVRPHFATPRSRT
ncbi:MAG: hypothetical protein IPJ18_18545 [Betaproteobacteria bacterium]|nr:hypothetical protein [Betaproteobacteria bacterium]